MGDYSILQSKMSRSEEFSVGQRCKVGEHFATIRYVGPVPPSEGMKCLVAMVECSYNVRTSVRSAKVLVFGLGAN